MKKFLAVPAIAILAAAGAASAAGFAGGVSAGPLQTGKTDDLTCATSAKVIEWGYDDTPVEASFPSVTNAKVRLTQANCVGQSVTVLPLDANGKQFGPRANGKVPPQASGGDQTVRVQFDTPMNAEQLTSVRISIDPGHSGIPMGELN